MDAEMRDKIRELTAAAIDQAFQDHVGHLFDVWLKDTSDDQPSRAAKGMQNWIGAYLRAQRDLKRWNPPIC